MDPELYKTFFGYLNNPATVETQLQKCLNIQTRHYIATNNLLFKKSRQPPHRLLQVLLPHEVPAILFKEDIKKYIRSCNTCQWRGKLRTHEPLYPIKIGQPFDLPTCQKKKFSTKVPSPKMSPNKTGPNEERPTQNVNQ
ncbi:17266_t:CDS:2 [Gigaspora margarita]|uniref:17266_t:CDS:1 n=1 Tax=Gigaspora margarita TaxID=4874 RepID=A0ABM8W5C5_GIGMA|nr:17266_t:CDS:2 [Gigaspora margarita]